MAKGKKLQIDPAFLVKSPTAFTVIVHKGQPPKRIALHGETRVTLPGGAGGPAELVTIPAPTQADLQYLKNLGHPAVIEVDSGGGSMEENEA